MNYQNIIVALVIVLFSSCNDEKKDRVILDKETYAIAYPASLSLDESGANGTEFLLFTEKLGAEDKFVENVNLMIQEVGPMTLEALVLDTENGIKSSGELISSTTMNNNGKDYQALVFDATMNNFDLRFNQHIYLVDNNAYVLTFTATQDQYDTYVDDMSKVLETFTIK